MKVKERPSPCAFPREESIRSSLLFLFLFVQTSIAEETQPNPPEADDRYLTVNRDTVTICRDQEPCHAYNNTEKVRSFALFVLFSLSTRYFQLKLVRNPQFIGFLRFYCSVVVRDRVCCLCSLFVRTLSCILPSVSQGEPGGHDSITDRCKNVM